MSKILIWHQGALGDLILSMPAIYAVRNHAECGQIHLVSRTDLSDIILGNKLADQVSSPDRGMFASLFTRTGHMPAPLKKFLGGFRRSFIFMKTHDDIFMENIRTYVPESFFIRSVPPEGTRIHVSAFQLDQVQSIVGDDGRHMPVLEVPASGGRICDKGPVIAIHPGSGGKKKCWQLDKYLNLIELIDFQKEYRFNIILGPAEPDEVYNKTIAFLSGKNINAAIIRDKSIAEVSSLLKTCSLYIGNDSGISHLASLLGTPVIAIFGPSDHKLWKPAGKKVVIVRADAICSPCPQKVYRNCQSSACLEAISTETVLAAIDSADLAI